MIYSIFVLVSLLFRQSDTNALQVHIHGISSNEGNIMIAVFDEEEHFLTENTHHGGVFQVNGHATQICSLTLKPGRYAVSVFHDLNGDGTLNTNFFGIPKEPYGFSNDARGRFGPPDYEAVVFEFTDDRQQINITLK